MPPEAHQTEAHRQFCADQTTFLLEQVRSIWLVKRSVHTALGAFGLAASLAASAWFPDASALLVAAVAWVAGTLVLVILRSLEDILCDFVDEEIADRGAVTLALPASFAAVGALLGSVLILAVGCAALAAPPDC
eukprot:CAMPEP_0180268660 /NCGR_PEP_ID=MMETSP0988-20121125/2230_1 /TAXON_ID=697907 /ORGANISM="non described non described, Strain CCMP2293" /LENGTH=133 /DNA_ID=CAMNT_0022239479 /DNA_START=144 /DNA_END=542 /DNA_ORIENTATION=-